jgi:hypothetical protein
MRVKLKKKQHKLWLNCEIENQSNFNKRDKEEKKKRTKMKKKILEIIIKVLNWKQNFFFLKGIRMKIINQKNENWNWNNKNKK